jgi:hypothetical protein
MILMYRVPRLSGFFPSILQATYLPHNKGIIPDLVNLDAQ